jgi:hypothetical protein
MDICKLYKAFIKNPLHKYNSNHHSHVTFVCKAFDVDVILILFLDLHRLVSTENGKEVIHHRDRVSSTSSTLNTPASISSDQSIRGTNGEMAPKCLVPSGH